MTTEVELVEGDCIEHMPRLAQATYDVCVTSPPYNLGIKYRSYNDAQKHEIYMEFTLQWLRRVHRLLNENGSLFLNLGGCPTKPLLPFQILIEATSGFVLQNTFHWIKSITVERKEEELSVGHFKPINSPRFVNDCHEHVFHLTKTGNVPIHRLALGVAYADKTNIKRWGHTEGHDKRCRGNNWYIPYQTIQNRSKRPHPATFPPKLVEYALRIHGGVNTQSLVVIDPFVGIGNAALGAMSVGVKKFTGIDLDEVYLAEAAARVKQLRGVLP